jgi:D-inositol-3-phosphate glycosyltransferase
MDRLNQSILQHAVGTRHIIRNGVDQFKFRPGPQDRARQALGLMPGRLIGLVVANLGWNSPSKDFQILWRALVRLSQRPAQTPIDILVVGRERPSESFGAVTIHHLPYCGSSSRLASYYQAADFLINPTHEETFSYVTAEAMCCGVPVLASKVGGLPEIINDGKTGLLVAPADAKALAVAIDRLSDRALRRNLSLNAAAYAKREFSIERMIERYLEVFDEAIVARAQSSRAPGRATG